MRPRWTTARAVSGGADFKLRVAEPTWAPSKESTGRVVSSERIEVETRNLEWDLGLRKRSFVEEGFELEPKIEEEKKAIDEGDAAAAISGVVL